MSTPSAAVIKMSNNMQIASLGNVSVHFMRHAETLQQAGSFPWLVRVSGIVVFWISCVLGFSLRVSKKSSDLCSFPASCQSVFLQLRSKLLLDEVGSSLSTFLSKSWVWVWPDWNTELYFCGSLDGETSVVQESWTSSSGREWMKQDVLDQRNRT